MSPVIARNTAVSLATAAMDMARRVQQGSRGTGHTEFLRIELPVEPVDLIDWLICQNSAIKIYWRDRAGDFEIAGIEAADYIATSPGDDPLPISGSSSLKDDIRYFGMVRFAAGESTSSMRGDSGDQSIFAVPLVAIQRNAGDYSLVCTFKGDESSRYQAFSILMALQPATTGPDAIAPPTGRSESSSPEQWRGAVERALASIRQGRLDKIVLARAVSLTFADEIAPFALLKELQRYSKHCFLFGFQLGGGETFIGASPERLYRRDGNRIDTEAVAGTRPRSDDPSADESLAQELLSSDKDSREHQFVASHIEAVLGDICQSSEVNRELRVVKLPRVQHLVRKYQGTLKSSVNDSDILKRLHPTPAVCGSPTDIARSLVPTLEQFQRSWYAGPVGWISPAGAEFAVGIRSALVEGTRVTLFGGAGIVDGSEPSAEWNEIEQKLNPFYQILKAT